jgi:hypothetical protein
VANIAKLNVNGTSYDVKDASARLLTDKIVTPQQFGAKGDGTTDDREALQEFFSYVDTEQVTGYIPEGTYLASNTIGNTTMTHGVNIVAHPRAILKAASGFPAAKFVAFYEAAGSTDIYFHWSGGIMVSENVQVSGSGQANDGLSVGVASSHPVITCIIENLIITPLESLLTDGPKTDSITSGRSHSDSCLMLVCSHSRIINCKFYYARDCGIYLSGGGDTLDYVDCVVDNCFFYGCAAGMTSKRQFRGVKFINNTTVYCDFCFADAFVGGSQTYIGVGSDTLVANNDFSYFNAGVGIRLQENAVVNGNRFSHCGINGTGNPPACILIQGSLGTTVSGNSFDLTDFDSTQPPRAVLIQGYTDTNSTKVNCNCTTICGNTYRSTTGGLNTRGVVVEDANQKNTVIDGEAMFEVAVPVENGYGVSGTLYGFRSSLESGGLKKFAYQNGDLACQHGILMAGGSITLHIPDNGYMGMVAVARQGASIGALFMVEYWGTSAVVYGTATNITITKTAGSRDYTLTNSSTAGIGFMEL